MSYATDPIKHSDGIIRDYEPCTMAYTREDIIEQARQYIRDEHSECTKDQQDERLGMLVDFLHDRFPPAKGWRTE